MKPRRVRFDIRRQGLPVLVALIVLIVINTVAWALLVRPKASEHFDRTRGGGGEEQRLLQEYRDSVSGAEAYVTGLGKAADDWRYMRTEVLSTREEQLVVVMQELTRLCAEFRIDLNTVAIKNEILREEGLDRFAMVVPLEGGYSNLRRFLQAVEASDKFMVVERVALDGATQGAASRNLHLNITVASYFSVVSATRPES
jgi:Tfp pilus assembly protein PilO